MIDLESFRQQYGDSIAKNYEKLLNSSFATTEKYGIVCPHCGHSNSNVKESRDCIDGKRRRRECAKCQGRFTTIEFILKPEFEDKLIRAAKLERFLQDVQDAFDRLND